MGTFLLVLLILVVLAVIGFVVALAVSGKRKAAAQAGLPGGAAVPASWAGDHSPEARMHRRLVAASRSLAALPLGDAASIERKVSVEQQIHSVDAQLVAAAAIPGPGKADTLARIEPLVAQVEGAVAQAAAGRVELDGLRRDVEG